MRVNGVVVLHPAIDESKGSSGIWDRTDPDVIALEGLHECLGHAVAFRALDRGEARHQVKRQGDLDGSVGGEDRAVVGQPLSRMRGADRAEALLDAADHHVADHLAGDAGGCRHPTDNFAVVAIESEGDAYDLAVPANEFQRVRAPAAIRADRCHLAVMLARAPAAGMAFEQEAMLLHEPIDALGVDRAKPSDRRSRFNSAAIRRYPGRSLVDKAADGASELDIAGALLRPAPSPAAVTALDHVRARYAERGADGLHRISPGSGECDSKVS